MVMNTREDLTVVDGADTYRFAIAPTGSGGKSFQLSTRPWQEGDPMKPWREKISDLSDGLSPTRLSGRNTYRTGMIDFADGTLIPPPFFYKPSRSKVKRIGIKRSTTTGTSLTCALPAAGAELNELIIVFVSSSVDQAITMTGYTLLREESGAVSGRISVYYKIAGGSETATAATVSASATLYSWVHVYDNVDTSTPIGDSAFATHTLTGTTNTDLDPVAVTPVKNQSKVIITPMCIDSPLNANNQWLQTTKIQPPLALIDETEDGSNQITFEQNLPDTSAFTPLQTIIIKQQTDGDKYITCSIVINPVDVAGSNEYIHKGIIFDDKFFIFDRGWNVWYVDEYGIVTYDGALNTDFTGLFNHGETFNGELIVGGGPTGDIIKRTTGNRYAWTQTGTSGLNAHGFATVGDKLWRIEDQNLISSAITAPLTVGSWVPASGNEYTAGDTSYYPSEIIEYDGSPWVIKKDGVYAPDNKFTFLNQAPQLKQAIDYHNGFQSFKAKGYLWVPSAAGLLRLTLGESIEVPIADSLYFTPFVNGGFEFSGDVYLSISDYLWGGSTVFAEEGKILRLVESENGYVVHELAHPDTAGGYIAVVPNALPTTSHMNNNAGRPFAMHMTYLFNSNQWTSTRYLVPTIIDVSDDVEIWLSRLFQPGMGSKLHTGYAYHTTYDWTTGEFNPLQDLNTEFTFVGLEIVAKLGSDQSITPTYGVDGAAIGSSMFTDGEASTGVSISNLTNVVRSTMYTALSTDGVQCRLLNIKIAGANTTVPWGSERPEIYDITAFGYMQPENTDVIKLQIIGDPKSKFNGIANGLSLQKARNKWRTWKNDGKVRLMKLSQYEESNNTYFKVGNITEESVYVSQSEEVDVFTVDLIRVNYKDNYAT